MTKAGKALALLLSRMDTLVQDGKVKLILKAFGVSSLGVIVEAIDKSPEGRRMFSEILAEINQLEDS